LFPPPKKIGISSQYFDYFVKENKIAGVMGRIPEGAGTQAIMKQLHVSKKTQESVSVSLQISKSLKAGFSLEVIWNKR
jgi:hypothetical protein